MRALYLAAVLAVGVGVRPVVAQEAADTSLYARLGGVYAIATVVDDFIERLYVNDVLNANPHIKASRDALPKAGLKYRVTELMCVVTGGPCKYTGRTMTDAHAHLQITAAQWDAMAADFKATLDHFNVPEKEQHELFTIVGGTKGDIVTMP